ncbi:MAG: S-layer homology domain-containing protein [Tissierellia bacterium]|nr:S-layer homology domain-containing protein [Tissierellia bacterium]MDD4439495.1 S-layer homology domain-containing protein [Tissierellia bacterium]
MKNIIKKITAFGLCALLAVNMNAAVYADVLDDIIGDKPVENTEDVENIEVEDTNADTENVTESINTVINAEPVKSSVSFLDIGSHWAKKWIENAYDLGFVTGYKDGTFKPDNPVTRAEFSTMLNKALKIEITGKFNFSDVGGSDWFYNEVQKSIAAGFFSGYENNTFRPNNPITRQEVAKVVSGAITTGNIDGEGATLLKDYNTIQEWAKGSVNTVYNKGYILGYLDKTYMPSKALTRGEAAKIIFEIVDNENIEYGFNITNYNETYSSAVVVGNLNVLDSVGNGNVYIKNVVVLGDIVISAENVNSVVLTDVKARNIIVESEDNPVKIVYNDNVIIANS